MTTEPRATPHVALIGLMGSGKSTVGRQLAEALGRSFVDVDDVIEAHAGRTISEIFAVDGESGFRAIESDVLGDLLRAEVPTVLATGGGAPLAEQNRSLLSARATVVWLAASPITLAARLEPERAGRPLLAGADSLAETLQRMADDRASCYHDVAHIELAVDDLDPASVVSQVLTLLKGQAGEGRASEGQTSATLASSSASVGIDPDGCTTVTIGLGDRSYPVVVGAGARHAVGAHLPAGVQRVAIVTQQPLIDGDWLPTLANGVRVAGVATIGLGEEHKNLGVIEDLCRQFATWGLTRGDAVVGVGGGMVTDVAGFAAASYHRGIAVLHVATSLLGMIDAAVGGKTGVNLPEGKNLVGAFWQPTAVFCDTETLSTLPLRELRCGYGEMAKYHFLGEPDLDRYDLPVQVARCVALKGRYVQADEREGLEVLRVDSEGGTTNALAPRLSRAALNYGHTLAHTLETAGSYDLRHGEAVAIGLIYAAELARVLGRIDDDGVAHHRRVVAGYDLPMTIPPDLASDPDRLVDLFRHDKKAVDGITFLLDGPNGVEPVVGIGPTVLQEALRSMNEANR